MRRPPPGGQGDGPPGAPSRAELALEARAAAAGWLVDQAQRDRVRDRLVALACDPASRPRLALAAARALIQADLAQQRLELDRRRQEAAAEDLDLATLCEEAAARARDRLQSRDRDP